MDLRSPAVAGRFYTANPHQLDVEITRFLGDPMEARSVRALMAPHAGYVYSGAIAGQGYRRVEIPKSVVILCPNHTGQGAPCSIWDKGGWQVPSGTVPIDEPLAEATIEQARARDVALVPDRIAHVREHSIEVHLPFLLAKRADVSIVPICLHRLRWHDCQALGHALACVVSKRQAAGDDVLLLASSDMSHYVSAGEARQLDGVALERIEALDPEGLLRVVTAHSISMCGVVPATVALVAALELGATTAHTVAYGHSGETSGDLARVVGYAAVLVH